MTKIARRLFDWVFIAIAVGQASWSHATYVQWTVDYPGAVFTDVRGINNAGQIVGVASVDGANYFSFFYSQGAFTPLPPSGSNSLGVFGITDTGFMVGGATGLSGIQQGFFYSGGANGTYTLFSHPDWQSTEARAIGNSGLITGQAYGTDAMGHFASTGFIYDLQTSQFIDIDNSTVPGLNADFIVAQGINSSGQVTGSYHAIPGGNIAFLRENDGTMTTFNVNGERTAARGINDFGVITGFISHTSGSVSQSGFVGAAPIYEILDIPGSIQTTAYGINNAGQVIGNWYDSASRGHGFTAVPAVMPASTNAGGAFVFNTAVGANSPIFIDPAVATGYDLAIGAGNPNFVTVSLPIGIGDSKYAIVVGANTFPVAGGEVFDFRMHGFASGVNAFGVRGIELAARLDAANQQAFALAVSFGSDGIFTGTMMPLSVNAYVVTNKNDTGAGSLRAVIGQANADPGPNLVTFDPAVTGSIVLTTGQIQISGAVTIVGPGAANLTVDGGGVGRIFSLFGPNSVCPALDGPDYLVSISGLRLTNGHPVGGNAGGAIFTQHSLALDAVTIDNSVAASGGALTSQLQYPGQSLTINSSQILNNFGQPVNGASNIFGAGIAIYEKCSGVHTTPVPVTIANSVFSGNRAQPVSLSGLGGAIATDSVADITITDSRIVNNVVTAPNPPVATQLYRGGGIYGHAKSLTIVRSEISNNVVADATLGALALGGGLSLFNSATDLQGPANVMAVKVVNSTVSGNAASASAGAMLVLNNVAIEVDNSTISYNRATLTTTGGMLFGTATGLATPTLAVASSILANNFGDGGDVATDIISIPTFTVIANNSLIKTICPLPSCNIALSGFGNLLGDDPMLAPLLFNGGPTRTHALLAGSPALNAGSNPLNLTTDQRGPTFTRTFGPAVDMGAYEFIPGLAPILRFKYSRKAHGGAGTFNMLLAP